jgi:hypothetical protein
MAQSNITYVDKVTSNPQPSIPEVNKVTGDDMTEIKKVVNDNATDVQTQLDGKLASGDNVSDLVNDAGYLTSETPAPVDSVNGEVGVVVLDSTDIGLGNVDNTSNLNSGISTDTQTALDGKRPNISFETQTLDFAPNNKVDNRYVDVDSVTDVTVTFNTGAFANDGDVVYFQRVNTGRILFSNGTASIVAGAELSLVSGSINSIQAVIRKSASVYVLTGTTEA